MTLEERIRERAHRIWEEEGRPHGRDWEHWERARREIEGTSARGRAGPAPSSTGPQTTARETTPTGNTSGRPQTSSTSASGLVGADDVGVGTPDAMGVDDTNVAGRASDPSDSRPTTGKSKLAGS